jgi:hypothetical protein
MCIEDACIGIIIGKCFDGVLEQFDFGALGVKSKHLTYFENIREYTALQRI